MNFLLCYCGDIAFGKCEENTVDKNGENDEVIEDLVGGDEDRTSTDWVPWCQTEERLGSTESMNVLLLEALSNN